MLLSKALYLAVLLGVARAEQSPSYDQIESRGHFVETLLKRADSSCSVYQCGSPSSPCGTSQVCPVPDTLDKRANDTELVDFQDSSKVLQIRTFTKPRSAAGVQRYLQARQQNSALINLINQPGSYCAQRSFAELPTDASTLMGMGNAELVGCTVMCLVSSRAVYMCHFVESLHFQHVNTKPEAGEIKYSINDVSNFLHGVQPHAGCVGDILDPSLFQGGEGDNTLLFFMTPRNRATPDNAASQEHVPEIQTLIATMRELVPGAEVMVYNYLSRSLGYPGIDSYVKGSALWEYDPNADADGNADWRLWFEETKENGLALGQRVV